MSYQPETTHLVVTMAVWLVALAGCNGHSLCISRLELNLTLARFLHPSGSRLPVVALEAAEEVASLQTIKGFESLDLQNRVAPPFIQPGKSS